MSDELTRRRVELVDKALESWFEGELPAEHRRVLALEIVERSGAFDEPAARYEGRCPEDSPPLMDGRVMWCVLDYGHRGMHQGGTEISPTGGVVSPVRWSAVPVGDRGQQT